eukprot:2416199-Amphidinium_carterae.1
MKVDVSRSPLPSIEQGRCHVRGSIERVACPSPFLPQVLLGANKHLEGKGKKMHLLPLSKIIRRSPDFNVLTAAATNPLIPSANDWQFALEMPYDNGIVATQWS